MSEPIITSSAEQLAAVERDAGLERASAQGAYWTGSRLFAALSAMLFGAAIFTYFYLHSLDNNGLWRQPGQRPSAFVAVPVLVLTLAGAVLFWVYTSALQSTRRTNPADWRVAAGLSAALFLAAGVLQLWGMSRTGFAPGSSGFASTYVATMPLFAVYCLGTAYWLETLFARSIRVRWVLSAEGVNRESAAQVAFFGSVVGAKLFVAFMAVLSIILYVLFSVLN